MRSGPMGGSLAVVVRKDPGTTRSFWHVWEFLARLRLKHDLAPIVFSILFWFDADKIALPRTFPPT